MNNIRNLIIYKTLNERGKTESLCLSVPESGTASLFILPDLRLHLFILLVLSLKQGWFFSLIINCSSRLVATMHLMPSFSKESLGTPIIDRLLFWTFSTSSIRYIGRSPQIWPAYSKKGLILEENMVANANVNRESCLQFLHSRRWKSLSFAFP